MVILKKVKWTITQFSVSYTHIIYKYTHFKLMVLLLSVNIEKKKKLKQTWDISVALLNSSFSRLSISTLRLSATVRMLLLPITTLHIFGKYFIKQIFLNEK